MPIDWENRGARNGHIHSLDGTWGRQAAFNVTLGSEELHSPGIRFRTFTSGYGEDGGDIFDGANVTSGRAEDTEPEVKVRKRIPIGSEASEDFPGQGGQGFTEVRNSLSTAFSGDLLRHGVVVRRRGDHVEPKDFTLSHWSGQDDLARA